MAATDKPFRNQYKLDIVFGVSCVLLLLTTGWMLYDDHYRSFKPIQRTFRDVEEALYVQQMDEKYPKDQLDDVTEAQKQVAEARQKVADAKKGIGAKVGGDADAWLKKQALAKAQLEANYQDTKANYDSEVSLYNILVDERDTAADSAYKKKLDDQAQAKKQLTDGMEKELQRIQHDLTENAKQTSEALADQKEAEKELGDAQDRLKKLTDNFDRTAKLAAQKRWKAGDWFRALPILDGFASPYKIGQITLNDLTIEYGSFKDVPRYDRCTTCHLAIDRAGFNADALRRLDLEDKKGDSDEQKADKKKRRDDLKERHADAVKFLKGRQKEDEDLGFDPGDLGSDVPSIRLSDAQIKQYSAHPRLDLFVNANSPHPLEKFGCTTCHAGQGSATDFELAVHTPNDAAQKKAWEKEHGWEPFHDWEYPMLPARFVESGCLKCHHQVTDLVRDGSREEAPKLLRGYNLIRENGCFGCHEISGLKGGKPVGPDLRLEPSPALELLTAAERARLLSDPANPPGTLRKVGPSLRRISEKTNEGWARKWINSPRGFRPDTKMPHFYNLSNNDPTRTDPEGKPMLADDQKDFPAAEITSIAHYLFAESNKYLNGNDNYVKLLYDRRAELEELQKNNQISPKQSAELIEVGRRIELAGDPRRQKRYTVAERIVDEDGKPVTRDRIVSSTDPKDLEAGRKLFTERGCLACHSHDDTEKGPDAVAGEAHFGPNLSRVAEKMVVIGKNGQKDAEASRRWVIQWVLNPNLHHPRTRMPIMHLKPEEAARVADWLLSRPVTDPQFQEWNKQEVPVPTPETLADLARVYLKKAPGISPLEVDELLRNGFPDDRLDDKNNPEKIAADADEQELRQPITPDKLKYYIGKKAISRLGCYGCHDVPGFELSKPIGTPLNDWGKKDPARIAFEDINAYVKDNYQVVELRDDPTDPKKPFDKWTATVKEGKTPYEKFFADALHGRQREGFLNQKIVEPRSYDYHRDLKWDDRLRMPQFKFAHPRREAEESDEDFAARTEQAEAEAREAVMTFILGLTAESIHGRYLNNPDPDHLAEVKGRQVIDKFNCSGCHLIRPGVYDFKVNEDARKFLSFTHDTVSKGLSTDYGDLFSAHNAWGARPPASPDRLLIHGVRPTPRKPSPREAQQGGLDADRDLLSLRLARALAFDDPAGQVQVFPASVNVALYQDQLVSRSDPFGGTFADLMVPYLGKKGGEYELKDGDSNIARRDLPPPLYREGERVQPEWLFNFVRNPTPIRPQVILRMPKFNMSDDEARALVNYFAAADKTGNPGIGLSYPYTTVREQQETYRENQARAYWERTGKEQGLQARLKKLQDEDLPAAKKKLDDAKTDVEKKDAEVGVAVVNAQVKGLQGFAKDTEDAARSLYWHDAYKLIATKGKSICLDCHRVGGVTAAKEQGPPLELGSGRLRPGWTEYWMANPDRLLTYPSVMPQNFPRHGPPVFQDLCPGTSPQQVEAIRDVLMNLPKVADLPVNRTYREATTGGK